MRPTRSCARPSIRKWTSRGRIIGTTEPAGRLALTPSLAVSWRSSAKESIMMEFECPECNAKMQAEDGHAGQQAICPVCNAPVIIPGGSATGIAKPEHAEQVKVKLSEKNDGSFREGEPTTPQE